MGAVPWVVPSHAVLFTLLVVLLECLGRNQIQGFVVTPHCRSPFSSSRRRQPARKLQQHPETIASPPTTTTTTTSSTTTTTANSDSSSKSMRLIQGLCDIVDDYDVFLLDMWGVMHDGTAPYEGVLDVVQQLKKHKKTLVILSNSSKRTSNSVKMLQKLGFDPADFAAIITSGEVAFQMLSDGDVSDAPQWDRISALQQQTDKDEDIGNDKTKQKKTTAFVLGSGDGDREYCHSCGWSLAPVQEASLIIARGTFTVDDGGGKDSAIHKRDNAAAYDAALQDALEQAAARQLPMLVCNPDKVRPDVERPPMPGHLGDLYVQQLQKQGGIKSATDAEALVKRVGKPFGDVYQMALDHVAKDNAKNLSSSSSSSSSTPSSSPRVCMVGDALETDVTGGAMAGVDTLWVLKDGIHSPDLPAAALEEAADDKKDESSSSLSSRFLQQGAEDILRKFNQLDGTYAAGRTLSPDMIVGHFRW